VTVILYDNLVILSTILMMGIVKKKAYEAALLILGLSRKEPWGVTKKVKDWVVSTVSMPKTAKDSSLIKKEEFGAVTQSWRYALRETGMDYLTERSNYWFKLQFISLGLQIISLSLWAGVNAARAWYEFSYLWLLPVILLMSITTGILLIIFTVSRADDVAEQQEYDKDPLKYGIKALGGTGKLPAYLVASSYHDLIAGQGVWKQGKGKFVKSYESSENLALISNFNEWVSSKGFSKKEEDTFFTLLPDFNNTLDELVETVLILEKRS